MHLVFVLIKKEKHLKVTNEFRHLRRNLSLGRNCIANFVCRCHPVAIAPSLPLLYNTRILLHTSYFINITER